MNTVYLFVLSDVRYGGFVTYVAHLQMALVQSGYEVAIVRIGNRTEERLRPFSHGLYYQNMSAQDATAVAHETTSLLCCCNWKQHGPNITSLLQAGAGVVLHDPTEFAPELLEVIRKKGVRPIAIRKANQEALADLGAVFIPHPYVAAGTKAARTRHAVSLSRIDWDKHTDIILDANDRLQPAQRIEIFGALNTMYAYHKLKPFGSWPASYKGKFPKDATAAVRLAASATYVVDMSAIAGDGGGTQYTFLEAWDAGSGLVLNKRWARPDEVTNHAALFAADGAELAEVLSRPLDPEIVKMGTQTLANHAPAAVIPKYRTYFEELAA